MADDVTKLSPRTGRLLREDSTTVNQADLMAPLTYTHTTAAVETLKKTVLAANANRAYACFANDSDTAVYLYMGDDATVGTGIPLKAGERWEMGALLGNLYTGVITAIHGGSGEKNLLATEASTTG